MKSTRTQILFGIVILALAMAGGWAATNVFQRSVSVVPGVQGCWRLEGSGKQIKCLSSEFQAGAKDAAGSATGSERDRTVIAYVKGAEKLAAQDSRLAGLCHPSMHDLGRAEGRRAAREERSPKFPGGSSQLCTAGYVHGLAEGYLTGTPTADVAAVFPQLCRDASARTGCAHGVGHALVRSELDTTAPTLGEESLKRCEDIPGAYPEDCFDGVYMELAMRTDDEAIAPSVYVERCNAAVDVARELSCWGYLGTSLTSNDVPMAQVPSWCAKASLPGQFTCIEGYGRDLGVNGATQCSSAAKLPELKQRCIEGAIGLQVGSKHVTGDAARRQCAKIDPASLATYCISAVVRYERGSKIAAKA